MLDYYHRRPPAALPKYRSTARPTLADAANGYLLVQPSAQDALHYAEVAVWKRPDGTDLIGANYQAVSGGPSCGDNTCEPTIHFYTYAPRGAAPGLGAALTPARHQHPGSTLHGARRH